ncbi:MAG: 1-acyl-sn-glycerol-3-phosphate acyltransferase [Treponema sp.]|nr:1-acyl-sn-glycerol-3-phosphate acyltransferase [Treponema sp.]
MSIISKIAFSLVKAYMKLAYHPTILKVGEPAIYIANHTALKDPPFMLTMLKGKTRIVVAKDWYEKKNLNWIMRGGTCIPCDRFSMDTEWTQKAKKSLQEGYSVIIFPEGKIRTDGELNEFKSGFAFLARYTGAPVIPIGISGIYKFGRKTRYVVGQAEKVTRTPGVPSSQDLAEKSEHFRQVVIGLKKEALEVKKK